MIQINQPYLKQNKILIKHEEILHSEYLVNCSKNDNDAVVWLTFFFYDSLFKSLSFNETHLSIYKVKGEGETHITQIEHYVSLYFLTLS